MSIIKQSAQVRRPLWRRSRVVAIHPGAELYGSDRMFAESVHGYIDHGHDVLAVLPGDGPLCRLLQDAGAEVAFAEAPVLRKSALSPRGLAGLVADAGRSAPRNLRLLRRYHPDVVYVSTLTQPTWLALAAATGARVVCHVHEAEPAAPRAIRAGLNAPLAFADTIIANSQFSASVIEDALPALARRTVVVANGVAGPAAGATPLRESLDDAVNLLFVGRISPRKGPHVAVEATRLLRESGVPARLELIGSTFTGYEWYDEQLRRDAADLAAAGAVTFTGFTDDVWGRLAAADIALVPSVLAEPFGNAAVEAILAGRPVAVGNVGGLPEAVAGARSAALATPGDAADLAAGIRGLVSDWSVTRREAESARERATVRFSPQGYRDAVCSLTLGTDRGQDPARLIA